MNALARRQWFNLGLLGLAGGLAALVLLQPDPKQPEESPFLLKLAPARIERIVVERPGQESLAFERRVDGWWMTAPTTGWANPVLLNPILHLAQVRCPLRYDASGLDLKLLHLDPPRLRLWLDDREIRLGTTTPLDGQRYLQIGATVHLCPGNLYPLLTSSAGSFLAPAIEALLPATRKGD